jgi:hypothetical protein
MYFRGYTQIADPVSMRNRRRAVLSVTKRRSVLAVQTFPASGVSPLVFLLLEGAGFSAPLCLPAVTLVVPAQRAASIVPRSGAVPRGASVANADVDLAEAGMDLTEAGVDASLLPE